MLEDIKLKNLFKKRKQITPTMEVLLTIEGSVVLSTTLTLKLSSIGFIGVTTRTEQYREAISLVCAQNGARVDTICQRCPTEKRSFS